MIVSQIVHQPVIDQVARYVEDLASRPTSLHQQLRDTLNRQRERMANLEESLGRACDEKFQLEQEQKVMNSEMLRLRADHHLTKQQLIAERQRVADLEAQLASYRRQALADKREIEMLKDQLFA